MNTVCFTSLSFPHVCLSGLLTHVTRRRGRRPQISNCFNNYDRDCSFHRLSYLQVHIHVCLTSHLVAHNFLQPLKMFVVSLTKHNHPQSSSDTMHFDTQPRHLHHCSNKIKKSHEKPTFSLKGEGRVLNKGKALPTPYSFIFIYFPFFLRKGAPFLHLLLTLVPLSHTYSLEPCISFNYFKCAVFKI